MLKFSKENAKTKLLRKIPELQRFLANRRKVYSLDMLAGWSCPGACDCLAKVYRENGRSTLKDGPNTKFRCFIASQEVVYPNVYNAHKHNWDMMRAMRSKGQCLKLLEKSMPDNLGICRWHVAGDFFKKTYFEAALELARRNPERLFYAYTKSLPFLMDLKFIDPSNGVLLPNFLITASPGGKYDNLIPQLGIRTSKVIFDESEAGHLPIDHDDSHAATPGGSFALLLHGVQPKGSEAAEAKKKLGKLGAYSRV